MCVCACVGVCVRGVWQARYAWDMCSLGQQIMWRLRQLQLQRAQAQVLRVSSAVTVVSRGVAWGACAASLSICVGSRNAVSHRQSTTYLTATYLWYLESWRRLIGGPTSLSMRLLTKPKLPTLPASGPRKGNERKVMSALSCLRGVLTMLALVIALHMIDGTGQRWQRSARSLQLWLWLRLPPQAAVASAAALQVLQRVVHVRPLSGRQTCCTILRFKAI